MEKVIQDLITILLDEEKIRMYSELTGYDRDYIKYQRTRLLDDLISIYNELDYNKLKYEQPKAHYCSYAFTKDSFDFKNKNNINRIERLYMNFCVGKSRIY